MLSDSIYILQGKIQVFFDWVHSTLHDTSSIFGVDSSSSQGEAMSWEIADHL